MSGFTIRQLEAMAATAGPDAPIHEVLAELRRKRGGNGSKARTPAEPPPPSQRRALKLVVPMPPNFSNPAARASRNPFAINGRKRRYWEMLDRLVHAALIPPPPTPCFGAVNVTSTMFVGGRMDRDNSVSRHKWVFDWLQDRGYLHNDRLVDWTDFPRQRVSRPRRCGLGAVTEDVAVFGAHRIELELREP